MKIIDYLTYRAWHEGVGSELDEKFFQENLDAGIRLFFGIETDDEGNPLSDVQEPEKGFLEDWLADPELARPKGITKEDWDKTPADVKELMSINLCLDPKFQMEQEADMKAQYEKDVEAGIVEAGLFDEDK